MCLDTTGLEKHSKPILINGLNRESATRNRFEFRHQVRRGSDWRCQTYQSRYFEGQATYGNEPIIDIHEGDPEVNRVVQREQGVVRSTGPELLTQGIEQASILLEDSEVFDWIAPFA